MIEVAAVIEWLAAAFLMTRAVCQLNPMTFETRFVIKVPYIVMAVASLTVLVTPFYGEWVKPYGNAGLAASLALLLLTDKRFANPKRPPKTGEQP